MPFPLIAIVIAIASLALNVISALLRPKTSDRPDKDWNIPTATEGRSIPVVWGTDLQRAPNIIWWGDQREVRRNNIWRYFVGIAWALSHGAPVLKSIIVNEKVIWTGALTHGQELFLNLPDLFGQAGGGIVWDLKYYQGDGTVGADPYLASRVPDYPDHRRVAYLVSRGPATWTPNSNWKGFIGNSPSLPKVEFELERFPSAITPPSGLSIGTLLPSTTQTGAAPPEWFTSDGWGARGNQFSQTDGWNNVDKYFQATRRIGDATAEHGFSTFFPNSPYVGLPTRPDTITFDFWVNYLPPHSGRVWMQLASGAGSLFCTIPNELLTPNNWSEITIPLTTQWPWRKGNPYTGPLATQQEIDNRARYLNRIQGIKIIISDMTNVPQGNFTARIRQFWFDKPSSSSGAISGDANPIWMLYEALTNNVWGCGVDPADAFEGIDDASFQSAANQVAAEGLGASYILQESMQFPRFADMILRHVDGVLYREPTNGKWTVRLIRNDYNPNQLLILDETNIIEVQEFGTDVSGVLRDVVRIKFADRTKQYKDSVATFRNPAVRAIQGYSSSVELDFPMVRDPGVAQRIAEREALGYSYPLRRLRVAATRKAANLRPGSVFRFVWAGYDVNAIFRVTSIRLGSPADGVVVVEAVEDKFSIASTTIGAEPAPAPDPEEPPPPEEE
jgi:hypothetical protein